MIHVNVHACVFVQPYYCLALREEVHHVATYCEEISLAKNYL